MSEATVVIMGGGLAGLTLALQLRLRLGEVDVVVLERGSTPAPEAVHKVGESTVEIGAHYLDTVLDLKSHLQSAHLKKFGFRFFFSDGHRELDSATELGASDYFSTPGYQIDRGVLENHLAQVVAARGVRLLRGAVIRGVELASDGSHTVSYEHEGADRTIRTRWVVDASGRAGLLRKLLNLTTDNGHYANAAWFRIGERLNIDSWSSDETWRQRCVRPERWLSTNHLIGPGYWVWLIPLPGGAHSVGIVADEAMHPLREFNSFTRAREWLAKHQPRLSVEIEARADRLLDFVALRRYSYGCRQVFCADRWALTGEAGPFLDPFYSPGTDFIAIGNTYITELIRLDLAGQPPGPFAQIYDQLFASFYDSTLDLYRGQYGMFGHAGVMPVKVVWDYTYYWGVLGLLYFQDRLTDLRSLSVLRGELMAARDLNRVVQTILREWAARAPDSKPAQMLDQAGLPWFKELNRGLTDRLDEGGFRKRVCTNLALMRALANEISTAAQRAVPDLDTHELAGADAPPPTEPLLFHAAS
jgi:flavin-dependent dehydrogenase